MQDGRLIATTKPDSTQANNGRKPAVAEKPTVEKAKDLAVAAMHKIYNHEPTQPRKTDILEQPAPPAVERIDDSAESLPEEFVARNHAAIHAMAGSPVRAMASESDLQLSSAL